MKRILGEVSDAIVEQWNILEQKGKKIVMYPEAKEHSKERHINEYPSEEDYYFVMASLEEIIKDPDYVFYDKSKQGLEYYKKIRKHILVAIRVVRKLKMWYNLSAGYERRKLESSLYGVTLIHI